jgi:hypothetical protein
MSAVDHAPTTTVPTIPGDRARRSGRRIRMGLEGDASLSFSPGASRANSARVALDQGSIRTL